MRWVGAGSLLVLGLWTGAAFADVSGRPDRDVLTQSDARLRANQVQDVHYQLRFKLDATRPQYEGEARIRFRLRTPHTPLSLDYKGKAVQSLTINGREVPAAYGGSMIALPGSLLKRDNEVRVRFVAAYDTTGDGFQRFVDPLDQRVYLYTNFEPYAAHRLFPAFDQPDLKATFLTTVEGPHDWKLIGNAPMADRRVDGDRQTVQFQTTPPISTYLYALHAGPYAEWHDSDGGIPLAIYARQSLAKFVDAGPIFGITRQGLSYFSRYFDHAYPFAKYDQVFVPELNAGAMENPGAVTLGEWMIFRHEVTDSDRFERDETILHEMAHMWFGNLVTMRWWNDLWLNESFATYLSYLAKEALPGHGNGWLHFQLTKQWAYGTDERVTTHPIEAPIADTDAAFQNFDGITYGKGASVMQQLAAFIGDQAFQMGVRHYFKRHAFANATLADFMEALQSQTAEDLSQWTKTWLQTAGFNTLLPAWQCSDNGLVGLRLIQGFGSGEAVMRPHRTVLGLFGPDPDGRLVLKRRLPVTYQAERTDVPVEATDCPTFVYANAGDQDYVKVYLDPVSLRAVETHLSRVRDPLVRQQIWGSLWAMVRDQQLPVSTFLSLVERHLPFETEGVVAKQQLERLQEAVATYLAPSDRRARMPQVEAFVWSQLKKQVPESDAQAVWADTYLGIARTGTGLERLLGILEGRAPEGLEINQDRRWMIVQRLTAVGHPEAARLLAAEIRNDPSDLGQKAADLALASRPTAEAKAEAWQRILSDQHASLSELEALMAGFRGIDQDALLLPYVDRYFELVPRLFQERDLAFAVAFARALYPGVYEPRVLVAGQVFLKKDLPGPLRKIALECHQEVERVVKIRRMLAP